MVQHRGVRPHAPSKGLPKLVHSTPTLPSALPARPCAEPRAGAPARHTWSSSHIPGTMACARSTCRSRGTCSVKCPMVGAHTLPATGQGCLALIAEGIMLVGTGEASLSTKWMILRAWSRQLSWQLSWQDTFGKGVLWGFMCGWEVRSISAVASAHVTLSAAVHQRCAVSDGTMLTLQY